MAENGPCANCGSTDRLEVDHIDRSTKVDHKVWTWAQERRTLELSKCQVLCHKCHKIKTKSEISKPLIHGTSAGYSKGCRCVDCGAAQRSRIYAWRTKVGGRKAPTKQQICNA